jgi:hypothetical protein
MTTIKYKVLPNKIVEGFALGHYFGCHQVKEGWKVTHLPSGYALCDPPFDSKETALALVMGIEFAFKDLLNSCNPEMLKQGTEQNQMVLRDFLKMLNEHPQTIIAGYFLDWFRERMGV